MAEDFDVLAAMGIGGFGKKVTKRELDPNRFDKAKRSAPQPTAKPETDSDSDNSERKRTPQVAPSIKLPATAPVAGPSYDPELEFPGGGDSDDGDEDDDQPQFPITHELVLKDHTKVVSALTLDPSGARILSGSHDYDCKLWDFGGMDLSCKPFNSWEPAGSYHVWFIPFIRALAYCA